MLNDRDVSVIEIPDITVSKWNSAAMRTKFADKTVNSVGHDQTAPSGAV